MNRLPASTVRYLDVNVSPDKFEFPGNSASAVFSDKRYVSEGGTLPADFCGASAETLAAAEKGQAYTVIIPENTEAELTISITAEEDARAMLVRGFAEPISKALPLEYAVEMNRLIDLEFEGAIG